MICPKCSHEQDDTLKCAACGIYFAKLQPAQTVTGRARRPRAEPTPEPGFGAGALVITAIFTAAAVFYFMRKPAAPGPSAPIQSPSTIVVIRPSGPEADRSDGGWDGLRVAEDVSLESKDRLNRQ